MTLKDILKREPIEASAPCRIDMGGTLDISTFLFPLRHLAPCTFNIALDLRTKTSLLPYTSGMVKVSSKGFKSVTYPLKNAPFVHPLGLMFAIASYFRAAGVHIIINSSSPPKSALGGSSAAAVSLIKAFSEAYTKMDAAPFSRKKIAALAHALEQSVAGVPCGLQDQLAAVYGGVNGWFWLGEMRGSSYRRKIILQKKSYGDFAPHLLLAYCGIPHESKQVNSRWIRQFVSGKHRNIWYEIVACTQTFISALSDANYRTAADAMNRETALRRKMTPEVLDPMGKKLVDAAIRHQCGARFTGAGGGGCIWALGETPDIGRLKSDWEKILSRRKGAHLLDVGIDSKGVRKVT